MNTKFGMHKHQLKVRSSLILLIYNIAMLRIAWCAAVEYWENKDFKH